jgi:putative transposase
MNKWLGSWAFYQQEQFLAYKAEALGKRVVHQDPRYTSQKCNVCKHIKRTNRHKSKFQCKSCGHQTHADLNAAKNIRDDYVSTALNNHVSTALNNHVSTSLKNHVSTALNNHILSSTYGTEEQGSVNTPDVSGNSVS